MAEAADPSKKKRIIFDSSNLPCEEVDYFEVLNFSQSKFDDVMKTCSTLPIGKDLFYACVPVEVEADLEFYRSKQNLKVLDTPNNNGAQVFIPGIMVKREVQCPTLPAELIEKMGKITYIANNAYTHLQSFVHLVGYWSSRHYQTRRKVFQDLILTELRDRKKNKCFTKKERKLICQNILDVSFDILEYREREMYYIFSTMERLRNFQDKAPYAYENLVQYFVRLSFYVWQKHICGICFEDCDEIFALKDLRDELNTDDVVLTKDQLLNRLMYCCNKCFSSGTVFNADEKGEKFYLVCSETEDGVKFLSEDDEGMEVLGEAIKKQLSFPTNTELF